MDTLSHFGRPLLDLWQTLAGALPGEWAQWRFMQLALLAVLLAAPLFALIGTQVVGLRLAFFSDTLGHAALTGLALGVVAGLGSPLWAMLAWAVVQALLVTWVVRRSRAASDTVLGVFMALSVALGLALLSRPGHGGVQSYTGFLVGDVLSINARGLAALALALLVTLALAGRWFNALALAGLNESLARSRGVKVAVVQTGFAIVVAIAVTLNIQWIGLLLVNAWLILPAAAARLLARNLRQYVLWTLAFSLTAGAGGLVSSYYWETATGATIVLWAIGFFALALMLRPWVAAEKVLAARASDSPDAAPGS